MTSTTHAREWLQKLEEATAGPSADSLRRSSSGRLLEDLTAISWNITTAEIDEIVDMVERLTRQPTNGRHRERGRRQGTG